MVTSDKSPLRWSKSFLYESYVQITTQTATLSDHGGLGLDWVWTPLLHPNHKGDKKITFYMLETTLLGVLKSLVMQKLMKPFLHQSSFGAVSV